MNQSATINEYAKSLVSIFKKETLYEFLNHVVEKLYPNQELWFMKYFMDLCDESNDEKFVVPYEKLIEFGVAFSNDKKEKKARMSTLKFIENEDYEVVVEGGNVPNRIMLTPQAFKLALMRARTITRGQTINPLQYTQYFLLVEKVVKYYANYERDFATALNTRKDDQIASLETHLLKNQEAHKRELKELMKEIDRKATLQREEILHDTQDAVEKLEDLREIVVENHQEIRETHRHMSIDVKESQRQFFAMTSYTKIGDNTNCVYFRNWRCQKSLMTKNLVKALSKPDEGFSVHSLVIPPIYIAGAINVGNAGKNALNDFINSKRTEWNKSRRQSDKLSKDQAKEKLGITIGSTRPTWTPTGYISHCQFVDYFLDPIKKAKVVDRLQVKDEVLQNQIDAICNGSNYDLINDIGTSRESIDQLSKDMMDAINNVGLEDSDGEIPDNEDSD